MIKEIIEEQLTQEYTDQEMINNTIDYAVNLFHIISYIRDDKSKRFTLSFLRYKLHLLFNNFIILTKGNEFDLEEVENSFVSVYNEINNYDLDDLIFLLCNSINDISHFTNIVFKTAIILGVVKIKYDVSLESILNEPIS